LLTPGIAAASAVPRHAFLAGALAAAASCGPDIPVYLPENGWISLAGIQAGAWFSSRVAR
jgi:hypothetical protein